MSSMPGWDLAYHLIYEKDRRIEEFSPPLIGTLESRRAPYPDQTGGFSKSGCKFAFCPLEATGRSSCREVNDHTVPSTGWLEFLRQEQRKTKARQCFKRCTCNRVLYTRFVWQEKNTPTLEIISSYDFLNKYDL